MLPSRHAVRRPGTRAFVALLGALALLAPAGGSAIAGDDDEDGDGFLTSASPMLIPVAAGVSVRPLITVGDDLANGYQFEAIPDGISIFENGGDGDDRRAEPGDDNAVHIFVNHETSTVAFGGLNDFDNAQVSELVLDDDSGAVLDGSLVIKSSANYQRFCSNFLADEDEGFDRPLFFTNEEAPDFVFRTGTAWPFPAPTTEPPAEQAGVVVALDPLTGEYRNIYGMGRHNHENSVAIPGYDEAVILSGDDTFTAPSSQLYMYRAADADAVWNDQGTLWAFRVTARNGVPVDPTNAFNGANDYGEIASGDSLSGEFIPVPDAIADGPDGDAVTGPQGSLESWSNTNNVFQFIRIEDIAYDRKNPNVVYMADTGEPRAIYPATPTGRLARGPSVTPPVGNYMNGRIFKLVLDDDDPTLVESLSILIDGDAGGYNNVNALHQPDNLETTKKSLLIQEDPGSHNQYDPGTGTTARIWLYRFSDGSLTPVAKVDQSGDPAARLGNWESSGIVDASEIFGKGYFLVDVQAHTVFIETADGPDNVPPAGPDWIFKREGGQLLLLRIRGA